MPDAPLLRIHDLSHAYGKTAVLESVSLELARGELVTLLGASGSGKTTLLRSIAGFVTPQKGSIHIKNRCAVSGGKELLPAEQRGIGLVFQDYALFPHLTALENVLLPLELSGADQQHEQAMDLF